MIPPTQYALDERNRKKLHQEPTSYGKRALRATRKFAGFLIPPIVAAVSPLVALPAVTSQFGESGWLSIAVGQSIGAGIAVFVELGWGLAGPQRVARQSVQHRRATYARSLLLKLIVLVPAGVAAIWATTWLSPAYHVESALVALGSAATGLNMVWFFVGTASPQRILQTDALPRIFCMVITAGGLYMGAPLWTYGVALLVSSVAAPTIGAFVVGVSLSGFFSFGPRRLLRLLCFQMNALSGRALLAVYISMPVVLVTAVAPASAPVFAAAERLMRMSLSIMVAVPNTMQRWLGTASSPAQRLQRAKTSVAWNAGLGLIAGLGFSLCAPWVSELLFSGVATLPQSVAVLAGCVIFLVCCSRASGGLLLVSLRQLGAITTSSAIGCGVGITAIAIFGMHWGAHGAFFGEILAELLVLLTQLQFARVAIRRKSL